MTDLQRQQRNAEKLLELYPAFRNRLAKVIEGLEAMGVRPRIQDAYRSPQDQLTAFNTGHSKLKFGFHNVTGPNGEKQSLAVDMLDDDNPLNLPISYLLKLAFVSEANGLTTGIRWGVPAALQESINTAIKNKQFDTPVKIGWDPSHVQPVGLTASEARAGKRPD
jgi:hypothetical protein